MQCIRAHLRADIFHHYRKCTSNVGARAISHFFAGTYQFAISSYRHRASKAIPHIPLARSGARFFTGTRAYFSAHKSHLRDRPTPFLGGGIESVRSIDRRPAWKKARAKTARPRVKRSRHAFTMGLSLPLSRRFRKRAVEIRTYAPVCAPEEHEELQRAPRLVRREGTAARARTPKIRK